MLRISATRGLLVLGQLNFGQDITPRTIEPPVLIETVQVARDDLGDGLALTVVTPSSIIRKLFNTSSFNAATRLAEPHDVSWISRRSVCRNEQENITLTHSKSIK